MARAGVKQHGRAAPEARIRLEPKQALAFQTEATEVLYGGAAGGGKSYLMRASAIRWCAEVPGVQVYLFRRTLPDLRDNHLRGPTSFHVMLEPYILTGNVRYRAVENEFEFWNGAVLHLCYCDSENDVEKYRDAEIHVLMIDELTHFSEYQSRFLRSRVRIAGLKVPEKYVGRLPRIETASNPGSIGHAWVKRTFISPKPALEIWRTEPEEGGMLRQFIPARLADNTYLTRDDPEYADRLRGLGSDNLVRAMLEGDWDIVAGQAFEKLRRDVHGIDPFEPPEDWMCFGSLDWGSSRPFSFGMWTVANGNALPDGRTYRRGAIIRFNEVYGWNGKPNEGMRKEAGDVADMLHARIGQRKLGYTAADPSMWKVDGGPSIAETFLKRGVILRKADNSRLVGYVQVRQRIAGDEDGPMLYATKNCHDGFWRTMPDIVMDDKHPEDVDCWIAGTMISTPLGERPIEQVQVGDFVDTPVGPRRVEKSYVSGPSETTIVDLEDGRQLNGTPHHRIYVEGIGLVPLNELKSGDTLIEKNKCTENLLYTRASTSGETRKTAILKLAFRSTALYGSTIMGRFLRAITSTIKITTETIIASRISNALALPTMPESITPSGQTLNPPKGSGPTQSLAEKFSEITLSCAARMHRSENLRASIVENLLKLSIQEKIPVPQSAMLRAVGSISRVLFAGLMLDSSRIEREKSKPVRIVAVGSCAEKTLVYNLTVDEAHLFYANGILSSNTDNEDHCYDDVRYACMSRPWLSVIKKKVERKKDWFVEKEVVDSWRTA